MRKDSRVTRIGNLEEFTRVCADLRKHGSWIFRGQANSKWTLSSKLERVFGASGATKDWGFGLRRAEDVMLRDMKRHFHRYSADCPAEDDNLEWLALLQHHGAPTRLVDWTFSEYVALFFATIDAQIDTSCAVWAVNQDVVWRLQNARLWSRSRMGSNGLDNDRQAVNAILSKHNHRILASLAPFRQSVRLTSQQGTFLMSVHPNMKFQTIFDKTVGQNKMLCRKLVIKMNRTFINEAWSALQRMNITHATLFPDIDGLARSMVLPIVLQHLRVPKQLPSKSQPSRRRQSKFAALTKPQG